MELLLRTAIVTAALGSGLIAGAFFVFSAAVMGAFARLSPAEGMRAMQSINLVIINPAFLGVFLGTAILSGGAVILAAVDWSMPRSVYVILGSVLYIVGTFLVTMLLNVPLNNALAAADSRAPAGQEIWAKYLSNWTFWNHVRTVASLAATAMFIIGLIS